MSSAIATSGVASVEYTALWARWRPRWEYGHVAQAMFLLAAVLTLLESAIVRERVPAALVEVGGSDRLSP